jgi:hypothetical protein
MPYVKWQSIPPVKGPDSQGISTKLSKNDSKNKNIIRKTKRVL